MKPLYEARVAIVGLGLMGGSLASAVRGRCRRVVGIARRPETVEEALQRELVDEGFLSLAEGLAQADIVILATPVRTILRLLPEVAVSAPPGCLVMDVGSTKAEIVQMMARLPARVEFLGGHPLCGKEVAGLVAADPLLYRDAVFVLTPLPRTSPTALALGRALVEAIGAHPLLMEPELHDSLLAATSHLPYLLACALVRTVASMASDNPIIWTLAASGFLDTSRLAASDPTIMLDILMTNRDAVLRAIRLCADSLNHFAQLVTEGEEDTLYALLSDISRIRQNSLPRRR